MGVCVCLCCVTRLCVVVIGNSSSVNVPSIDKERLLAHLDHNNPSTFEVEDLTKLIKQVDCIACLLLHLRYLQDFQQTTVASIGLLAPASPVSVRRPEPQQPEATPAT